MRVFISFVSVVDLDSTFLTPEMAARFANVSQEQGDEIIAEKDSKKTQKQTKYAMNAFNCWLAARQHVIDEKTIPVGELDGLLYQFYLELRKQDGSMYAKNGIRGIRHGVQRHFKKTRNIDIINDSEFTRSSTSYTAQCVVMKKSGLAKVNHKEPLTLVDVKKLYSSGVFDIDNPASLQRKVFFELELYFCRRAMENLRTLTKRSFAVKTDEYGTEYVELDIEEFEKNHGAFDDDYEGGVMMAKNRTTCPVASFKKYLSKLNPSIDTLFQRPRSEGNDHRPWYDAQVVGIKTLEKMMKTISVDAGLSQIYTNHCIRATCITTLDEVGFPARHIMSVSGHRSEASVRSYSKTKIGTKRRISDALSELTETDQERSSAEQQQRNANASRPSSSNHPNIASQEDLRAISTVPTFDFAISSAFKDIDDETSIDDENLSREVDKLENVAATSNPVLQNVSFLQQFACTPMANIPSSSSSSSMQSAAGNFYFGANSNPVFINCTFK